MLNKNLLLIPLIFFASLSLGKNYEISINFESGFEYQSQKQFIESIKLSKSSKEIEHLIDDQDWIKNYSIRYKPFKKEVFINIKNREPIFVLNEMYFYEVYFSSNFDEAKRGYIQ